MIRKLEDKIVPRSKLARLADSLHQSSKKIVSTNGCFDLLHLGHMEYLKQASELGDVLIIFLNSDISVKSIKGPNRPIHNQTARSLQLAALEVVDYVTIFDEDTPENVLTEVKPHLHVKGGDYKISEIKERTVVESHGGTVKLLPLIPGYSTTDLIEKLKTI